MNDERFAGRAQTNIDLYRQLIDGGRSAAELRQVQAAYRLAARFFAGQVRPEGRPFVCHLVGVASILASLGEPVSTVCAGLLHSALAQGDFGAGRGFAGADALRLLAQSLDERTLDLVERYDRLPWDAAAVSAWASGALDDALRPLLLLRLANLLEDALGGSFDHSDKGEGWHRSIPPQAVVALGQAVGGTAFAGALATALAASAVAPPYQFLREAREASVIEAPLSYRPKRLQPWLVRLRHLAVRARGRLARMFIRSGRGTDAHRRGVRGPT